MELFKWIGVASSTHQQSIPNTVKPISHAAYKQFGLENFGNTCYANAVLQALYFCQPFRDLVCDSAGAQDRSSSVLAPPLPLPTPVPSTTRQPTIKAFRRREPTHDSTKSDERDLASSTTSVSPSTSNPNSTSNPANPNAPPISTTPPTLFSALRSLYLHIALNPLDKGTVSPLSFINKLKKENELYRSSMHQDAHEFLNFLLNKIVEDLEVDNKQAPVDDDLSTSLGSLGPSSSSSSQSSPRTHPTFVHTLFEGTLTSETRCLTCETVSSRDESFLDLSIDIDQNTSVSACLRQFSASEMLSHKNKFFCDSCGGLQEAEKRMKIKKPPNVLALHLKRFKYQEDLQKYIKLAYRVAFPFELRLFNTVDDAEEPDRLYRLFAVVVHIGGGPHHGHYIAIVKPRSPTPASSSATATAPSQGWLIFDDDNVDPIRESDIPRYFGDATGAGAGYVLFYESVALDVGVGVGAGGDGESVSAREGVSEQPQGTAPRRLDIPLVVLDHFTSDNSASEPVTAVSQSGSLIIPTPTSVNGYPVQMSGTASPSTSPVSPTLNGNHAANSPASPTSSGGGPANFFRTLKHSQSIKIKRAASAASSTSHGGAASEDGSGAPPVPPVPSVPPLPNSVQTSSSGHGATANGDVAPPSATPVQPTQTLSHSRSFKDTSGWWNARWKGKEREKDGKGKSAVPPVPVLDPESVAAPGEKPAAATHLPLSLPDDRRPSAPGILDWDRSTSASNAPSSASVSSPSRVPTPPPKPSPSNESSRPFPVSSPIPIPSAPSPPPPPLSKSLSPSALSPPVGLELKQTSPVTASLPPNRPATSPSVLPSPPHSPLPMPPTSAAVGKHPPVVPVPSSATGGGGLKLKRTSRKMSLTGGIGNVFGRREKAA